MIFLPELACVVVYESLDNAAVSPSDMTSCSDDANSPLHLAASPGIFRSCTVPVALAVIIVVQFNSPFTSTLIILLQMAELSEGSIPKENLEFRRCIILAIVGSTPVESANLKAVLETGYLSIVKTWYDQILQGSVGASTLAIDDQFRFISLCNS